ncbi:hypothetical protein AZH11_20215 [Pseudomonas simiae]|nr:hypothetical protein AZH11_20215 [Pseudomonas simiae]
MLNLKLCLLRNDSATAFRVYLMTQRLAQVFSDSNSRVRAKLFGLYAIFIASWAPSVMLYRWKGFDRIETNPR